MMLHIPDVLTPEELAHCRSVLEKADWQDGKATAGQQSAKAKHNLQLPLNHPQHRELAELVLRALGRNRVFNSAVVPFRVVPPLFNRYDAGMAFGAHVDNAVRPIPDSGGMRVRTDVSCTLFLSHPEDYDGENSAFMMKPGCRKSSCPQGI